MRFVLLSAVLTGTVPGAAGCDDGGQNPERDGGGAPDAGPRGFDDLTVPRFASVDSLEGYVVDGIGVGQTKFVIPRFWDPARRTIHYLDGHAYEMHDEWYWLRLLNGQTVPGVDTVPLQGLHLPTPDAARDWARTQPDLPLDLRWVAGGARLYSSRFYTWVFDPGRRFGVGSLLRLLPRPDGSPPPVPWVFEIEYGDGLDHPALVVFFETLTASLPDEVGDALYWVTRSPEQRALAERMAAERLPWWDRVLGYSDLARQGEVQVYSPGLTAGTVRFVRSGEPGASDSGPRDVLVVEDVPDWLPPAAALITAVPQTPLAHVSLLARNRGIPDAYVGGALDDPFLNQLRRGYSPILVHAEEPDRLDLYALTRAQFATYVRLVTPGRLAVPPVDVEGAPWVVDLEAHEIGEMDDLRLILGGKSTGFLALLDTLDDPAADVAAPHRPLALTMRTYVEHFTRYVGDAADMLGSAELRGDARARALVLEGEDGVADRFPDTDAAVFAEGFLARHPPGDVLGDLARAGGLVSALRDAPLPSAALDAVTAALRERFGGYAVTQGLRFRSSSNVEDIEGFTGAGLYESYTGFLDPAAQPRSRDRERSVEWALRHTLASYWSVEAFEERRLAGVDHLSGEMGVLVHARFDDDLESANGVFVLTLLPPGADPRVVMELNVQAGDLSVTNPPPGSGALPEVVRAAQGPADGPITLTRVRPSTEVPDGAAVMDDTSIRRMFEESRRVGEAWLAASNARLDAPSASRTAVLDFEVRVMRPGWPALAAGQPYPPRTVLKQVRSLAPGIARVPAAVAARPFPRDLLARARRVEHRRCAGEALVADVWEAWTAPSLAPDLGYERVPFLAEVVVRLGAAAPRLDLPAGHAVDLLHPALAEVAHPGLEDGGPWALSAELTEAAAAGARLDRLELDDAGGWALTRGEQRISGDGLACEVDLLHGTPGDYLRGLLDELTAATAP